MFDADGTNKRKLSSDAYIKFSPSVSAEGRHIVLTSDRAGDSNIWRMDIDGSNLKQLTEGNGSDFMPVCSLDGAWVVFNSSRSGKWTLWKVPIDGGAPVQLTTGLSLLPGISPDGKWIAFVTLDEETSKQIRLAIMPFEGGPPVKSFSASPTYDPDTNGPVRWSSDGRALTYIDQLNGADNIWSLPINGDPPKALTNFKSDRIFSFAWSRDGKQLAVSHGTVAHDVVLIKDFR